MTAPEWLIPLVVVNLMGLLGHFLHDLILFTQLRNDVKWMKAVLRSHNLVAPNGDQN